MNTYKLYCNDMLPCVYCSKCVNLYYAKSHLKTKKCLSIQELIPVEERQNLFLKYIREINQLKSEIRLSKDGTVT